MSASDIEIYKLMTALAMRKGGPGEGAIIIQLDAYPRQYPTEFDVMIEDGELSVLFIKDPKLSENNHTLITTRGVVQSNLLGLEKLFYKSINSSNLLPRIFIDDRCIERIIIRGNGDKYITVALRDRVSFIVVAAILNNRIRAENR